MNKSCMLYNLYSFNVVTSSISLVLVLISFSINILFFFLEHKFKKMNNNLYYREELFNSLCSNVNDVFIIFDAINMKYEYISPNFERILGISGKLFIKNYLILLENVSDEKREELMALISTSPINSNIENDFEFYHPITHKMCWMTFRVYPVYNNNTIIRYISSITDVTKEKQSQQVLEDALLNVQKANEAKKDFLSHMSHELKTPINAIIGITKIATNTLDDITKTENYLTRINTASNDLLILINNILDMAKVDSDKLVLTVEPFSLSNLLNSFSSLIRTQADLNCQTYDLVLNEIKDDYLLGDGLRLSQIIGNCLSNSLKFTPAGGKIKLEVYEIERYENKALFRFTVSDNGKGMSEEYIERIFIPFEQEDCTISKKYGGTGLGMSITKNLVQLMEGTIGVISKVGVGSIINIDIAFDIPLDQSSELKPDNLILSQIERDCAGKRILVVEDNEINLEITCEFLKYIKVVVETATNGYEAIRLFETSGTSYYDVILMDVQMPGLNGYDTTKVIRNSSHPDANRICIIAMTADSFEDNITFGLNCGMNYHIAKPIDLDKFYSLLHQVITKEIIGH